MTDPEAAAAGEALERTFIERAYDQLRDGGRDAAPIR